MILSLFMRFSDRDIIQPARWRGFGNYNEAFHIDPVFWKSIAVAIIYTLVSISLGIAFSLGLALLLSTKVKGIAIRRTCFYIPALASPVATTLIWVKLFQPEDVSSNGPTLQTNELGLSTYNSLQDSNWHLVMAGSVMVSIVLLFLVGQRYFVKGLAMGGE